MKVVRRNTLNWLVATTWTSVLRRAVSVPLPRAGSVRLNRAQATAENVLVAGAVASCKGAPAVRLVS